MAPGDYRHILVTVDNFNKWMEVRPITIVTSKEAAKFMEDITHRFGVPNRIVTDLGTTFTGSDFWDFCQDSLIDFYYSSVAHPCCNGQVERANGMVRQGIKDRIFDDASQYATRWLVELPHVIWGLWTQVNSATGHSPFFLVYGSVAVLPIDLAFGAPCIQQNEEGIAEKMCKVDHDSIEEHHVAVLMQHTRHEQQLPRYHDHNVHERSFNVGDLVVRHIQDTKGMHKLSAPWEGPFIVMEVIGPATYRLQWADGLGIPNVWNIEHLRRFYP
jgi:hypothetical protein